MKAHGIHRPLFVPLAAVMLLFIFGNVGQGGHTARATGPLSLDSQPSEKSISAASQKVVTGTDVTAVFEDDFSDDPNVSGKWTIYRYSDDPDREASWDMFGKTVYLTRAVNWKGVAMYANYNLTAKSWQADFRYKAGGGSGADGFTFFFYKDNRPQKPFAGGNLGFHNTLPNSGYAIEFDNWAGLNDPSANHIALVDKSVFTHVKYANDSRTEDNNWHQVSVQFDDGHVSVMVDGSLLFEHAITAVDYTFSGIGFSASTGDWNNNHVIDDFVLRLTNNTTITGRVTDASGHGIPGVTVWAGFSLNTTTDANGNYTFTGLPAGTYTIRPDKEGYSFFVPASITVTLPSDPATRDFIGYPCVAPSGLDVCALQAGDILLTASPNTGSCGNVYRLLFNLGGTYFTHTGLYLGQVAAASNSDPADVRPRIAQAQNPYVVPDEQVHETWLTDTLFWTGDCLMDWVVVRPAVSADVRNGAIQWARAKADEGGVLFDIMATKQDQKRFYCSKFTWMAYKDGTPGGPDLEADRGIGSGVFGQYWVTPDDLYYSSPVTQAKEVSPEQQLRRGFFWIWSPAHLTLVDPAGRRTGYDSSTGGAVYEIPDSTYVALPDAQVESITAPGVDSRWQIIVTGYATGDYVLESGYANKGTRVQIMTGSTFSGKIETYPVADPEYVRYLPIIQASH